MAEPRYLSGDDAAHNGGYDDLIDCDTCGTEFDRNEYRSNTCSTCEDTKLRGFECDCEIENNIFLMCEGHKRELEHIKNNPPRWAIKAKGIKQ